MRHYENLVIVKPTLTEEELKAQLTSIEEVLTSNGASIVAREDKGIKKLAYQIEKNARGYIYVMYYTIEPSSIAEVERRFKINEELLRYVTIKYDTNREIKAWNDLVAKANKKAAAVIEKAAPVVEETAPVVEEVAPVAEKTEEATS